MLVRVDLPGVRPEDVRIDATERFLAIHVQHQSFARMFQLPPTLEGEAAIAIMSDGILTVRIPRRSARSRETFAA